MGRFELHTVDTAPEGSKGTLQAVEDKYGFAPNLMKEFAGAPEQAVEAVRSGDPVDDGRLDALRRFTQEVTARRGWVGEDAVQAFLDAGYEQPQVLEVITGIALKTLSNYTNHIGQTPLDDAFQDFAWEGEREAAGV